MNVWQEQGFYVNYFIGITIVNNSAGCRHNRSIVTFSQATMASEADIRAFIDRQRVLLAKERDAEIERSSLLLSNCGPKLLEQKGLSLGGLGIVGMNIGLGGKTYVPSHPW